MATPTKAPNLGQDGLISVVSVHFAGRTCYRGVPSPRFMLQMAANVKKSAEDHIKWRRWIARILRRSGVLLHSWSWGLVSLTPRIGSSPQHSRGSKASARKFFNRVHVRVRGVPATCIISGRAAGSKLKGSDRAKMRIFAEFRFFLQIWLRILNYSCSYLCFRRRPPTLAGKPPIFTGTTETTGNSRKPQMGVIISGWFLSVARELLNSGCGRWDPNPTFHKVHSRLCSLSIQKSPNTLWTLP